MAQKTYADFSKGWITHQSPFNQDPKSLAFPKNGYFSKDGSSLKKREGSQEVLDSDFDPKNIVANVIPFVSAGGKKEWVIQDRERFYRLDGQGGRTLLGTTQNKERQGHTKFQGRLIIGNENSEPYRYWYLTAPPIPSVEQVSSGSLNSRTYYIQITYNSSNGETDPSIEKQFTVDANNVLKVNSPPQQDGADSYNVYVGTASGEEELQESDISIGDSWTEPDSGLVTGDSPPSDNTAWVFSAIGGTAPVCRAWETHSQRVFAARSKRRRMILFYSALQDEDTWHDFNNPGQSGGQAEPGIIDLNEYSQYGNEILGLASIQDRIVVLLKDAALVYLFPEDATDFRLEQVLKGFGGIAPSGHTNIGGELLYLSKGGVQALSQEFGVEKLTYDDDNPSSAINNEITEAAKTILEDDLEDFVEVEYFPRINSVMFLVPQAGSDTDITETRIYVFDLDLGAWTFFENLQVRSMGIDQNGKWYGGTAGNVIEIFDGTYDDQGNTIDFKLVTPWLYLGSNNRYKKLKFIEFPVLAGKETTLTLRYDIDFSTDDRSSVEVDVSAPGVDQWDDAQWDSSPWTSPVRAFPRIPIHGRCQAVKFTFENDSDTHIEIPWYRVDFLPQSKKKVI